MSKQLLIPVLMILACGWPSVHASAQKTAAKNTAINEAAITSIRSEFKRINSAKLRIKEVNYEAAACADGGRVQYFYEGKDIVKIIETGSIGDGSWTREFYYQKGKFIFSYDVIVGMSADGQDSKIEHRLYVREGKIVRYMEDQKEIAPDSSAEHDVTVADNLIELLNSNMHPTTAELVKVLCE
jgi:hypothetical protein